MCTLLFQWDEIMCLLVNQSALASPLLLSVWAVGYFSEYVKNNVFFYIFALFSECFFKNEFLVKRREPLRDLKNILCAPRLRYYVHVHNCTYLYRPVLGPGKFLVVVLKFVCLH